jgi:hypothetical protein
LRGRNHGSSVDALSKEGGKMPSKLAPGTRDPCLDRVLLADADTIAV